jgi:hypothetical protein
MLLLEAIVCLGMEIKGFSCFVMKKFSDFDCSVES